MKKLITITLFLILIYSCKRVIFNEEQTNPTNNTGISQTITFDAETMEKLFPENGQSGGVGKAGVGNFFEADLWSDSFGWHTTATLYNLSTKTAYSNASIKIFFKTGENTYTSFQLAPDSLHQGRYNKIRMSVHPQIGKRAGYFHIIAGEIDFKIGFGIQELSFNSMMLNGAVRNGQIDALSLSAGTPLNIQFNCPNGKYYDVVLFGPGGKFQIKNYYAPTGNITIPGEVTSHFPGSISTFFVTPHTVYILDKFVSHIYKDNNKLVPSVSVRHGANRGAGSFIRFQ